MPISIHGLQDSEHNFAVKTQPVTNVQQGIDQTTIEDIQNLGQAINVQTSTINSLIAARNSLSTKRKQLTEKQAALSAKEAELQRKKEKLNGQVSLPIDISKI